MKKKKEKKKKKKCARFVMEQEGVRKKRTRGRPGKRDVGGLSAVTCDA